MKNIFYCQTGRGQVFQPRAIPWKCAEIEIVVAGRGRLQEIDGTWREVAPGDMLWYHSREVIEACADRDDPYAVWVWQFEEIPEFRDAPRFSSWSNRGECPDFCDRLAEAFHAGLTDAAYWRNAIARCYWEILESRRVRKREGMHPALRKALKRIDRGFAGPLTVEELARHAGVSAAHLFLLFRRHFGVSPGQLIMSRRLEHARNLLLLSSQPIKTISAESGFPDPGNFAFVFKRRFKMTPEEFRSGR